MKFAVFTSEKISVKMHGQVFVMLISDVAIVEPNNHTMIGLLGDLDGRWCIMFITKTCP